MKRPLGAKKHTVRLIDLEFDEQAKSLNMRIHHLKRLIQLHLATAEDVSDGPRTKTKCLRQVQALLDFTKKL